MAGHDVLGRGDARLPEPRQLNRGGSTTMATSRSICNQGPTLLFKRGATFTAICTYLPVDGGLPDLVGATITSQIRYMGTLVQELQAEMDADGMGFRLYADEADTAKWPVATCLWDIRISVDEQVIYSETIYLNVIDAITVAPAPAPAPAPAAAPVPEAATVAA